MVRAISKPETGDKLIRCLPPSIFDLAPPAVCIFFPILPRVHLNFLRKRGSSHARKVFRFSTIKYKNFCNATIFSCRKILHPLLYLHSSFRPIITILVLLYLYIIQYSLHHYHSIVDNGQSQGSEGREGRQASFYRQERRRRQSYRHAQGQV